LVCGGVSVIVEIASSAKNGTEKAHMAANGRAVKIASSKKNGTEKACPTA